MKALLLYILTAAAAFGINVTLVWDANPPGDQIEFYTVYEETEPGEWVKLGETADGSVTSFVIVFESKTRRTFAVTATNLWGESFRSAPVSTPGGPPEPPSNPRIEGRKRVAMESSEDLKEWKELAVVASDKREEYFRIKIDQ